MTESLSSRPPGQHFTITNLVRDEDKAFGFAISDDGVEFFIPRNLVVEYDMDADDVGAGLYALTKPCGTPERVGANLDYLKRPVTWDGDTINARFRAIETGVDRALEMLADLGPNAEDWDLQQHLGSLRLMCSE